MRLKSQKGNGIMLIIGKCEDDKHNIFLILFLILIY